MGDSICCIKRGRTTRLAGKAGGIKRVIKENGMLAADVSSVGGALATAVLNDLSPDQGGRFAAMLPWFPPAP
jgi:hypothetical protein